MSDIPPPKPKQILRVIDLITGAQSANSEEQKKAWMQYCAWCRAAPTLRADQRLTAVERVMLEQLFAKYGFRLQ